MWQRSSCFFGLAASVIVLCISFASTPEAMAQGQRGGLPLGRPTASITVYLRASDGTPITVGAQISVTSSLRGTPVLNNMATTGDGWTFSVDTGDEYEIEAQAAGYQTARQSVTIPPESGFSTSVVIFLKAASDKPLFKAPAGKFLLAPRAQKEVDKGLKDLQAQKWENARKHFAKAVAMAPGNPYVNYLLGMGFLLDKQMAEAAPYLEKSVSIDPKEPASQHALGSLYFQQHHFHKAIEHLGQCVKLDPGSWKSHWLLADSYLHLRDYAHARDSAIAALKTSKGHAGQVQLILGGAYFGLGERTKAAQALSAFLKQYPNDKNASAARWWLNHLQDQPDPPIAIPVAEHGSPHEPIGGLSAAVARPRNSVTDVDLMSNVSAAPPLDIPPRRDWAPADIDSENPFIQSDLCSLPAVLAQAGRRAEELVGDLQRFSAVEEYQWVEIKRNQTLGDSGERKYAYVASISHPNPNIIEVDDTRDQGVSNSDMPGRLVDLGAPGLVLAFHPLYRDDFLWSCKGLGEWKGKPAWVVHFAQRSDRTPRLATFNGHVLPLKGLAWVSQANGEIMHMETDLMKPVKTIQLEREHFVVDYQPVRFRSHNVTLWLPSDVDVYYHFQRHYLHHSHHFSNFKLFWVGSSQKISKPKQKTADQSQAHPKSD